MSVSYTLNQEQVERLKALGSNNHTQDERLSQILNRGLGALELQNSQRAKQKTWVALGRQKQAEQQKADMEQFVENNSR